MEPSNSFVITNAHVLRGSQTVRVFRDGEAQSVLVRVFRNGEVQSVLGEVMGCSSSNLDLDLAAIRIEEDELTAIRSDNSNSIYVDLAVIGIEEDELTAIRLANSNSIHIGQPVFAIGAPLGYSYTLNFWDH
ncbi:MAG: hypothetical protein HC899_38115 [Leptolyngbyaceae cyanobacterium SM1_4_3]|nr:hypothetical protein [Leptolyngbyaceae cyanobacterium SM1_4_3]